MCEFVFKKTGHFFFEVVVGVFGDGLRKHMGKKGGVKKKGKNGKM